MNYRRLGRTGFKVGEIGLGTEYLQPASRETIKSVLDLALDSAINYLDMFFAEPNFRDNIGSALGKKRDKMIVAGHIGTSYENGQYKVTRERKVAEIVFYDLLARLKTDYIDVLMIHYVDQDNFKEAKVEDLLDFALSLKEQGKIRTMGLSCNKVPAAINAIKSGVIDVLMFPVYLTKSLFKKYEEVYLACEKDDIGLVAMKPFGGGKLLWETRGYKISPLQCLSYVLSIKQVSTVVPGVKNVDELKENLNYLHSSKEEKSFIEAKDSLNNSLLGECVFCNHCLPCPSKINIGETIRLLEKVKYYSLKKLRIEYKKMPVKASACIECVSCEQRCFMDVDIIKNMKKAADIFE
jgi:predicted aldo/keto reductase-like oxidoreductase